MPSSVGSRVLPTSCQLLTLGSRRRPILYRPGSTRGGRKGPVHLSGAILIGRNATVHKDCGKEAVDFFEAFCIAPLARHCYLTTELCIMQTSGADADTLQALPLARHPCREQPHYKPKGPRTNRGPFSALALLRYSFPVGFELSLLQRQNRRVQFLDLFGQLIHRRRECVHLYIRKGLLRATQMVPRGHVLVSRKSVEDLLNRRINRPANRQ